MFVRFADESGGALFNIGPLTIIDAVFEGNTAAAGGLAIANAEPLPDMGNVTFHGNLLSCSPGEYSDFDQVSMGVGVFVLYLLHSMCFCHQPY